jgi:TatD DNase family protein
VSRLPDDVAAAIAASRPLVDSHCHLVLLDERGLLDAALEAAAAQGVEQIVSVGLDVEDSDANRRIAERHAGVFFTVGWHPHQEQPPDAAQLHALDELLRHPRAVAVGEIGIDCYWRPGYHQTPLEVQQRQMRMMLDLAAQHGKPVVVHDRDAHAETLCALDAVPGTRGVMHCFSGDAPFALQCRERDMVCSFAGTITFPRSERIQAAAAAVDAGGYMVETDAPFLAPVPHRGRDNQPAYVAATCAAVARLRGVEPARAARESAENARRLFALPDPARGDRLGGMGSAA